jgi:hypothetical protein
VGSNKRYAAHYDAVLDARIGQEVMRGGQPRSLAPEQLELDREPLTRLPIAEAVSAWVARATGSGSTLGRSSAPRNSRVLCPREARWTQTETREPPAV